jgi:hypothetical protein
VLTRCVVVAGFIAVAVVVLTAGCVYTTTTATSAATATTAITATAASTTNTIITIIITIAITVVVKSQEHVWLQSLLRRVKSLKKVPAVLIPELVPDVTSSEAKEDDQKQ